MNGGEDSRIKSPWQEPWPSLELEHVGRCPICGDGNRSPWFTGLKDKIFFTARGTWTLQRCHSCGSGYLDPRPTKASIGDAYDTYYTHEPEPSFSQLPVKHKIARFLANSYRARYYGVKDRPGHAIFGLLARPFPSLSSTLDGTMRHLCSQGMRGRLLDVGCGDGKFLKRAAASGWDVVGLDFDPRAVATARSRGLDVRLGEIDDLGLENESFDVITLSHVLEHVHDPGYLLGRCHNLLRRGGKIWIEVPNAGAQGLAFFGESWRGLEPPRHLTIPSFAGLSGLLERVGFQGSQHMPWRPLCETQFRLSAAISKNIDPYGKHQLPLMERRLLHSAEQRSQVQPDLREFITIEAIKGTRSNQDYQFKHFNNAKAQNE